MDPEMISKCKQKFFAVILVNMLNYRHDGILQKNKKEKNPEYVLPQVQA